MWFSKNLRYLRLKAGLSQDTVGDLVGKKFTTIQRWETAVNEPNLETANKLADFFHVSLDDMCYADLSQRESAPNVPAGWYYEIPAGISAGALEDLDALYELPRISIPDSLMGRYAHNPKVVFIHINGQSMDKIIADGSVVAVMTGIDREQLRDGDLVVVSNGHGYTVKQFFDDTSNQRIILRPASNNPVFTDIIFPYDSPDPIQILGRVVIYSVFT